MIWYSLSVSVRAGATVMRIAGVHAHRVDVFDGADDDGVVGGVAHHFHLELFPAQQGFVDRIWLTGEASMPERQKNS